MSKKRKAILLAAGVLFATLLLCLTAVYTAQRRAREILPAPAAEAAAQKPAALYAKVQTQYLTDADGAPAEEAILGCPAVFFYWAGWCEECRAHLSEIDALASETAAAGGRFYLLNREEATRENVERAQRLLREAGAQTPTLYDPARKAFDALGLTSLPSVLVCDAQGRVTALWRGALPALPALRSALQEAKAGKLASLGAFITRELMDASGGVRSGYTHNSEVVGGEDVLAETQGAMMLYALQCGDDALFDSLWGYVKAHRVNDALSAWVVTPQGDANANALVDDLRILRALCGAQDTRGGYEVEIATYADALYTYNTERGRLVDFYDFGAQSKATSFTLCYADLEALYALSSVDARFASLAEDARGVVEAGFISEAFPLYYSWYDYTRGVYPRDDLNMAEALTTLLHLSRVQALKPASLAWLRARMEEGWIWAQYEVDGDVSAAGRYESTAVYALVAQIAVSEGDLALAARAIERMESFKVRAWGAPTDCAFGEKDGAGIYSFDQCMALLAYACMEDTIKK